MNNEFNKMLEGLKSIKLSEAEKNHMKSDILSGVVLSPYSSVTNPTPARHNYQWNIQMFTNSLFKNKNYMTALLLAFMLVVGGGSSAMAEKAIPGDALYQMKVSVNEPIVGMLTLSKEGDVAWQERLVERRLEEAQKVVAGGTLSTSTQAQIEANVHAQVDKFNVAVEDLSHDNGKDVVSSELAVRLESALKAHQAVLAKNDSDTTGASPERKDLLISLHEDEVKVKNHREEIELQLGENENSSNATTTTKVAAENKQDVATKIFANVKNVYQEEKAGLATSTRMNIETSLTQIEKTIEDGQSLLAQTKYTEARNKFQEVLQSSNDVRVEVLTGSIKGDIKDKEDSHKDANKQGDTSERDSKSEEVKSGNNPIKKSETDTPKNEEPKESLNGGKNTEQKEAVKTESESSVKVESSQKIKDTESDEKVEVNTNIKINN